VPKTSSLFLEVFLWHIFNEIFQKIQKLV